MSGNGIPYFPLMCQMDEKLELIEAEFGPKGFAVVVKLWQRIYGDEGYYCKWTQEVELLFARKNGFPAGDSFVSEVVRASLKRELFSGTLFQRYGILTSHGIQKRYLDATSRRKIVVLIRAYILVEIDNLPENVCISDQNVYIEGENVDISKQSKVKESKGEESRGKKRESRGTSPPHATEETEPVKRFAPPSVDEVRRYIEGKGLHVDPEKFYLHYQSNGWMVGRVKMKSWQATIEKWARNEGNFKNGPNVFNRGNSNGRNAADSRATYVEEYPDSN